MTNYTATFCSTNLRATDLIEAETPEQALALACEIAENYPSDLEWYPLDPSDQAEEIEITDSGDVTCAIWRSDDLLLQVAAADLFDALEDLVERDRAEAAECGFSNDEMTWLEDARRALAKAKGGAA